MPPRQPTIRLLIRFRGRLRSYERRHQFLYLAFVNGKDHNVVERVLLARHHVRSLLHRSVLQVSAHHDNLIDLRDECLDLWRPAAPSEDILIFMLLVFVLLIFIVDSRASEVKFGELLDDAVHDRESKEQAIGGALHGKFELFLVLLGQEWVIVVALKNAIDYRGSIDKATGPQSPD